MKMPMFETKEQRAQWAKGMADAIERNGLKQALEALEDAVSGKGRSAWLKMNNIPEEDVELSERMWNKQLAWLRDNCLYLIRKVKKYRKMEEA